MKPELDGVEDREVYRKITWKNGRVEKIPYCDCDRRKVVLYGTGYYCDNCDGAIK